MNVFTLIYSKSKEINQAVYQVYLLYTQEKQSNKVKIIQIDNSEIDN